MWETMIEVINHFAGIWWSWMLPMFWQVSLLVIVVWAFDLLIHKWVWPQVRYLLWLLILLKLILPPAFSSPVSVTSRLIENEMIEVPVATVPRSVISTSQPPLIKLFDYSQNPPDSIGSDLGPDIISSSSNVVQPERLAEEKVSPSEGGVAATSDMVEMSLQSYLMLLWLLGACFFSVWLFIRFRNLQKCYFQDSLDVQLPDWFDEQFDEISALLKLKRKPKIILSQKVHCPAVFGVFRPVFLMPANQICYLSKAEGRHIILHELAHIKRKDLWLHAIYMALQILYWFHPLVWWTSKRLQHLRELCCDATVSNFLREKTKDYRETLIQTAKALVAKPVEPGMGLLGLFEDSHRLVVRLRWLDKQTWRYPKIRLSAIAITFVTMLMCVLPMAGYVYEETFSASVGQLMKAEDGRIVYRPDQDAEIEILGITSYPLWPSQLWWAADGSLLPHAPEEFSENTETYTFGSVEHDHVYLYMLTRSKVPDHYNLKFVTPQDDVKTFLLANLEKNIQLWGISIEGTIFSPLMDVEIALASGAWNSYDLYRDIDLDRAFAKERREDYPSCQLLHSKKNRTMLALWHSKPFFDLSLDGRIVAISNNGDVIAPTRSEQLFNGNDFRFNLEFPVKASDIKSLRVQYRRYISYCFNSFPMMAGVEAKLTPVTKKIRRIRKNVRVSVVDKQTQKPIPHATVFGIDQTFVYWSKVANKQGKTLVELEASKDNKMTFSVSADGYGGYGMSWNNIFRENDMPGEVLFELEPGYSIGGIVINTEGQPIKDVVIDFRIPKSAEAANSFFTFPTNYHVRTDADGRWRCDNAPEKLNEIQMRLNHPGYIRHTSIDVADVSSIDQLRQLKGVMVMHQGYRVRGRVVDQIGAPIVNARVVKGADLFGNYSPELIHDRPRLREVFPEISTYTDADGYYQFNRCPSGPLVLTVFHDEFSPDLKEITVGTEIEKQSVDFHLGFGIPLEGVVVNSSREPVRWAIVMADQWRGHRTLEDVRFLTDEKGNFYFPHMPLDEITFSVFKDGEYSTLRNVALRGGQKTVRVTLPNLLNVKGNVIDAQTGEKIKRFRVIEAMHSDLSSPAKLNHQNAVPFTQGQFELTFQNYHQFRSLCIEAEGYLPAFTKVFDSNEAAMEFNLKLQKKPYVSE